MTDVQNETLPRPSYAEQNRGFMAQTFDAKPIDAPAKPEELPKHEISDEDRDSRVKSIRALVQEIHNRNDQDTNKVLDNIIRHLDAIDGNPEQREAERAELAANKVAADKRAAKAKADEAKAEGEKVA
jgi:hypothetical protein